MDKHNIRLEGQLEEAMEDIRKNGSQDDVVIVE